SKSCLVGLIWMPCVHGMCRLKKRSNKVHLILLLVMARGFFCFHLCIMVWRFFIINECAILTNYGGNLCNLLRIGIVRYKVDKKNTSIVTQESCSSQSAREMGFVCKERLYK